MNFEQADIDITNNAGWIYKDHQLQRYSGKVKMVNYKGGILSANRPMVVMKVNGHNVPFYLSSGEAGKDALGVSSGKWYPIFGIDEDTGWVNKGTIDEMKSHYGSKEFKAIAEHLDATIGDIRGDTKLVNSLPQFTADGLSKSPELRSAIQGSFEQYGLHQENSEAIRAKNLEILKTPKTLPPPPTPTSMPKPSSPKPDINSKVWQNIVRRHLLSTAQAIAGNYDGDVAMARQRLAEIKSGKIKLHPNAGGLGLAEIEAGLTGKYSISAADEEALLKEVGDKLSEERMARAEHSVKQEKWNKESKVILDKLNKESVEIEAKLKKKFGTDLAGYNSAQGKADREMEIKVKKARLELDGKMPKAKSPLNEQINVARGEGAALGQHRTIMALPEKERAEAFKKLINTLSEQINDSPESKEQTEHTVKRLKELAAEDGVTKPKLSRAIAAVGGAVKKAGAAVLPASGRTTSLPSEVVRPTVSTAASEPIPPKPATPVPAGLPPPPSAATPPLTATPTVPVVPLPSAAQQAAQGGTTPTGSGLKLQTSRPFKPVDDAQAQLARLNARQGGVAGVSRGGVAVNLTTAEELAGTRPAPVDKTNANSIRPPSYENPVQVKVDTPSETTAIQTATRKAQLEEQVRTGKLPPKSGVSLQPEQDASLLDIAKRQLPTLFKVGDAIANIGGPSKEKRDAAERFKAEQKVKADAKAALARLTEKPAKTFYNPNTGRSGVVAPQLTTQQASGVMSPLGDRVSRTLYSDILPYARGIQNPQVELSAVFGNDVTQKSFIEKALVRSGRFTADEIGGVVRSILNNPDAMSELTRVIGHLPVENQPLKSGGAPKPFPQRPTGNSLPKVTPIQETARDRLAAQKAAQEAVAKAAQEAELLRIAAEEKAAFDLNKHNVLVEQARKADEAAQALIAKNIKDEIRARSPAGTEDAWWGTRFYPNSEGINFFPANSGVTRFDRLRQIAVENKRGVNPLEIKLARLTGGQPNTNIYGDQMGRTLRSGQAPPSAGARVAGQVGNVGAQGVGYLPDIMTAYALSRGGPISPDNRVLYPHEVTTTPDNATFETAALQGLARYHPDNADRNPDVTHRDRFNYHPQWYKDENDARTQDIAEFVKQTGFSPEPMRGSQQVPQAILDAIRSQR